MGFLGIGDNNGQNSGMGFGLIGNALGGMAAGIYGNQAQNNANSYMSDHVMDRQEDNARLEMQFQERMSNSAYQRATADMRAAGINPMMAATQGGASTPAGAMGGGGGARMENIASGVASTAMDALRLNNETKTAGSVQALNQALSAKAIQDASTSASTAKMTDAQREVLESQRAALAKEADVRAIQADYNKSAAKYDAIMSRAARDSGSVKNIMGIFGGGAAKNPTGSILMNGQTGEILKQY